MRRPWSFAIAADFQKPAPILQVRGHHAASKKDNAMLVEFFVRPRGAESLEIIRRGVGMEMHGKQLALDQIRLGRLSQADGDISLAHRQIQLFVSGDQRDVDVWIKIQKFTEPRREPMYTDAGRSLYFKFAIWPLPAVGELGAGGLELHKDFMRGPVQQFALLGEDQSTCVAMKQRNREFGFQS